jgi:hypothetical protein
MNGTVNYSTVLKVYLYIFLFLSFYTRQIIIFEFFPSWEPSDIVKIRDEKKILVKEMHLLMVTWEREIFFTLSVGHISEM